MREDKVFIAVPPGCVTASLTAKCNELGLEIIESELPHDEPVYAGELIGVQPDKFRGHAETRKNKSDRKRNRADRWR